MDKAAGLKWIEEKEKEALNLLKMWARINSWSHNDSGLETMAQKLIDAFQPLSDRVERSEKSLCFSKRKKAKRKILLGGHMDTVYPPDSPFQDVVEDGLRLKGPGVADMKGGLVVGWLALSAFEKFASEPNFGWDFIINADEEIGSPHSRALWEAKGREADLGLLFEPSFPDGAIVTQRKGSLSFHLDVEGKAAHAGRDFHEGKSAVKALAQVITEGYQLAEKFPDLSFNAADLRSDRFHNIVAAKSSCIFNIRSFQPEDLKKIKHQLDLLVKKIANETGTHLKLQETASKQPKLWTEATQNLWDKLEASANQLGIVLMPKESGGLSDGNILAGVGLPCLDSLGVIGGKLHTPDEYMEIKSMIERAKLTFLFLIGELDAPR